jgi:hypothetical protein
MCVLCVLCVCIMFYVCWEGGVLVWFIDLLVWLGWGNGW